MFPAHLHPRTWPTWVGLGIFRLLILLPYPVVMRAGAGMGHLIWKLLPAKRKEVLTRNLERCFPEMPETARDSLAQRHIEAMGQGFIEATLAWWGKRKSLEPLVHLNGFEHLQAAQQKGKGVILLSAHFSSLEIGGRLLGFSVPFHAMYRPSDNPAIAHLMQTRRAHHVGGAIPKDNVKELIRTLRKGEIVWYAPDQSTGAKNAVFAPFFGIQASTNTATSRLSKMTGSPVVPFLPLRRKDGKGYDLNFYPALDDFPSGDDIADATRMNALFESWIRQQPEDYFWFHRRFKIRPEGEPAFYTNRAER